MSRSQYENFDAGAFLHDLYGGVFAEQAADAIKEVASGVDNFKRQGTVTMTFKIKPFEGGEGVTIEHDLKRDQPERNGNNIRKITNKTHMHVGRNGAMSTLHEKQQGLFESAVDEEVAGNVTTIKRDGK